MNRIRKTFGAMLSGAILAAVVAGLAIPAPRVEGSLLIDTRTLGTTSVPEILGELGKSDLVFVGESHNNRDHHGAQLTVIRSLRESGDPIAIGLEMFRASSQKDLDDWVAGRIPEERFAGIFAENWSGAWWPAYRPIFRYARQEGIPMVGLNVERHLPRQVSREGAASLAAADRPGGRAPSCDASQKYQARLREILRDHMRHANYRHFCEAQMLWDASMAWRLIGYSEDNPGTTVVVLAGGMHSWKHGIPERVRKQSSLSYKVILPSGDRDPFGYNLNHEDADYVWWFEA